MRINIKKYNSKTFSQKDHWGKGPTKQKEKKPLFKKDTFYIVKQDIIRQARDKILNGTFEGFVKIDLKLLEEFGKFILNNEKEFYKLYAETEVVFKYQAPVSGIVHYSFSSSYFHVTIINPLNDDELNLPNIYLTPVDPTDEEVYIELMNRELNK